MKQVLILSLAIVSLCITIRAQNVYDDAEAYAVYSAIVFKEWPVTEAKSTRLVIKLETSDYPHIGGGIDECLQPPKGEEAVYAPVVNAYKEANKTPKLLQPKFTTDIPYVFMSGTEFNAFFDKKGIDGWKDFYDEYPKSGGINELSAVGFNADKTLAIVYVGHSCGGLCGGGTYHVLQKKEGKWTELQWRGSSCMWAS